jgi:isoquinoline 1-oxidoreductase beta subunit
MDLDQRLNVAKTGTGVVSEASLSRRTFLRVSAAAGGGLLLSFILPRMIWNSETAGATTVDVFAPNAFIRIDRDGRVTFIMPYVEMGQGTYTSIPMLIAEELEVDLAQVTLEAAPPDEQHYANSIFHIQATGGSTSVRAAWEPLRQAGATARTMLVSAAAQAWKVDPTSCRAKKGEVIHVTSGRKLKYGAWLIWERRCRCRITARSRTPRSSRSSAPPPSASTRRIRLMVRRNSASTSRSPA